jgi:hypothetical protein
MRVTSLALAPAFLVLAWGIHGAREWARRSGAVLCGLSAAVALLQLDGGSLAAFLPIGIGVWLALPSTKKTFAEARVMIQRTAEIRREKANAKKLARQRIAARRRENASPFG